MRKNKLIELTTQERERLEKLIDSGTAPARQIKHAQVLHKLDQGWQNKEIVEAFNLSERAVILIRKRFLEEGLESALVDKPRPGAPKKFLGEDKAMLVALTCSDAPEGHSRWTLRLLADRMVELGVVESISHTKVADILKKTN